MINPKKVKNKLSKRVPLYARVGENIEVYENGGIVNKHEISIDRNKWFNRTWNIDNINEYIRDNLRYCLSNIFGEDNISTSLNYSFPHIGLKVNDMSKNQIQKLIKEYKKYRIEFSGLFCEPDRRNIEGKYIIKPRGEYILKNNNHIEVLIDCPKEEFNRIETDIIDKYKELKYKVRKW